MKFITKINNQFNNQKNTQGAMLKRFYELWDEVELFMKTEEKAVAKLNYIEWICDLSILVDITTHFSVLNIKLNTENESVSEMYANVCAFKNQFNYNNSYEKQIFFIIFYLLCI